MKFNKNLYLIGVAALAAFFLLPGCVSQPALKTPEPLTSATVTAIPEKRTLNIWHPNATTTLNPYFSLGNADFEPARIPYEPLADFDKDGNLTPILAVEIPSFENGDLDKDNKFVIWKLRRDVFWSDGERFTADDVKFTYSYIVDPEVNISASEYGQITNVEALDDYTIKVTFKDVNPAWALPFVGIRGVILPKHIFESYKATNAREAPANILPIGTGPYRAKDPGIKPQEVLLLGSQVVKTTKIVFEPNPFYRFPEKIAFKQVVWRAGGEITESNRLLFEEGSIDIVFSVSSTQIPLNSKGKILLTTPTGVERILFNFTDPGKPSQDGEYSSLQVPHPLFSDKRIRQAFAYAINRKELIEKVYENGVTANAILVSPPQYLSQNNFYEYDLEKAKKLLDEAGYIDTNSDGFREKDGVKMKVLFQAYVTPYEQQAQQVIKENLNAIGIDVELKKTDAGIMFGAGTSNPDSISRFNADMAIFATTSDNFDPAAFMESWLCKRIPQKSNNWSIGNNNERWCSPAFDDLLEQTKTELDPAKRQEMFIQLNDMLVEDAAMIPLVWDRYALGVNVDLVGLNPTPWDALAWNIQDWRFTQP